MTTGSCDPAGPAVEVARLNRVGKRFGSTIALEGVSLRIVEGELVALLGPNGAGKTTAIEILLGLRRPTTGDAYLFGKDPRSAAARRAVGATPQETGLPAYLRLAEICALVARHYPDPWPIPHLLQQFGLVDVADRQAGGLSVGLRRRLALALAFVGRPRAVFLDEPSTGLDVEARRALWQGVRAFHEHGGTVVLSTHQLDEAEALATRVVLLHRGTVVADDSVRSIRDRAATSMLRLPVGRVSPAEIGGLVRSETAGGMLTLYVTDPERAIRDLVARNVSLDGIEVTRPTLEDAFLDLTHST
jgi:ABC-2 type transport system ATP-binding protein